MLDEVECSSAIPQQLQSQLCGARSSSRSERSSRAMIARDSKSVTNTGCNGRKGAPQQQPLSFGRWFARRARAADILLLVAELLFMGCFQATRLLAFTHCESNDGIASSSDSGSSFPCGASYPHQLLFTLRSGAVLDLRLRWRAWDYSNIAHTCGQLLAALLALMAPSLYERTRHVLFTATSIGTLLGAHLSLCRAPDALLPLIAPGVLSSARRRMGAVYFGWKAVTVFRVPASHQVVIGPLLWLLAVSTLPAVDRRLPPPPQARAWPVHAAFLFVAMAVLPFLLVRTWERASLRPRYHDYLRRCAAANPGDRAGSGGTNCSSGDAGASSSDNGDSGSSRDTCTASPASKAGDDSSQVAAPSLAVSPAAAITAVAASAAHTRVRPRSLGILRLLNAPPTSPSSLCAPVLYRPMGRDGGGVSRTVVFSAKLPIRHDDPGQPDCPTFEQAAASVATAAAAALRSHDASLRIRSCGGDGSANGCGVSQVPVRLPPPLRNLSAVCVRGCVQLLFAVHQLAGQLEGGEGVRRIPAAGGGIPVRHLSLPASTADGNGNDVDAAAVGNAVQQLLAAEDDGTSVGSSSGGYDPRNDSLAAGASSADDGEASNPFAFAWPPAWPVVTTSATTVVGTAGEEEDEEGEAVVVVVAAAALHELRSVRCVVAGPCRGQPQQAAVYMDVDVDVELLSPQQEGGEVFTAIRVAIPSAALRTTGMLLLHLLPPHTASAPVSASTPALTSTAPLAMLPLLVLPAAAAQEMRELYSGVLGTGTVSCLERLLWRPEAAAERYGGSSNGSPAATADAVVQSGSCLAAATAALQASGLTALVLDMGALLQLPPYGRGEEPEREQGYDEMGAGGDNLWVFADLIRFMSARRMAGCLREGLRAMRRAGVQLTCEGGPLGEGAGSGGDSDYIAGSSGARDEDDEVEAATRMLLAAAEEAAATGVPAAADALVMPSAQFDAQPIGVRSSSRNLPPTGTKPRTSSTGSGSSSNPSSHPVSAAAATAILDDTSDSCRNEKLAPDGAIPAPAFADNGRAVTCPRPPPRRARLAHALWWLRALLLGFPQRPHEAAYQAYKAAACRAQDCLALLLFIGIRAISTLRTYRDITAGATDAIIISASAAEYDACVGTSDSATSEGVCPAAPSVRRASLQGSCGGLTAMQLQLVAQCLWLTAALAAMGMALFTRMQSRRRNAFLLLRGVIDGTALLLVLLPVPWPGPLLSLPDPWIQANRQVGIHWIVFGFWEPLTLQLSPYLQALQGLIYLLPMTLLGFHTCYFAWRPALSFGFGHIACTLAVSAATDLYTRCHFIRRTWRDA